jgi:hypothetical protein
MKRVFVELSPDNPQATDNRRQKIIFFWNELRTCGNSGATTWEVLESLERQVTEYIDHNPPEIRRAESLTAYAALLIEGCNDL